MNDSPVNPTETPDAGRFDPEKAAQLRSLALGAFRSKNQKIMRVMGGYLIVLVFMAWVCLRLFNRADDAQSWVFYGVLFLLFFESTVLIKLWYWVAHTKLEILREIKVLRMDLALHRDSLAALEEAARIAPGIAPDSVSKTESYAWGAVIVTLGVLLGVEIARHGPASGGWLSFRSQLLDRSGDIAPGQTNVFPFVPSGKVLVLGLRADTKSGTVGFEVCAPDGRLIGGLSGGGLTRENWMLEAPDAGTYTLRITSHEATGRWRVHMEQTQRPLKRTTWDR